MREKLYVKHVNIENKTVGCRFNDEDFAELHRRAQSYNLTEGQYLKALALSSFYKKKIDDFIENKKRLNR